MPSCRSLKPQVLQRCSWRVVLLDDSELRCALADLGTHPSFDWVCRLVTTCARCNHAPLGSHGHSPECAAAAAAAGPSPDAGDGRGRAHGKAAGAAGSAISSAQTGLDGRYWQQAATAEQPSGRGAGRQLRQRHTVLGPFNRG